MTGTSSNTLPHEPTIHCEQAQTINILVQHMYGYCDSESRAFTRSTAPGNRGDNSNGKSDGILSAASTTETMAHVPDEPDKPGAPLDVRRHAGGV